MQINIRNRSLTYFYRTARTPFFILCKVLWFLLHSWDNINKQLFSLCMSIYSISARKRTLTLTEFQYINQCKRILHAIFSLRFVFLFLLLFFVCVCISREVHRYCKSVWNVLLLFAPLLLSSYSDRTEALQLIFASIQMHAFLFLFSLFSLEFEQKSFFLLNFTGSSAMQGIGCPFFHLYKILYIKIGSHTLYIICCVRI